MRIIPTWEKPTCVRSRLGRTLRIREAQAAHSHTTSHIERDLPAQRHGLGENAEFEQQNPPFQAQRPGSGEIGWNKIPPWEKPRIARAVYLGKRQGASLPETAVLSRGGTLRQIRPDLPPKHAYSSQAETWRQTMPPSRLRYANFS